MSLTTFYTFCISFFIAICLPTLLFGQSHDVNKSVQVYAEVESSAPHIILKWDTVANAENYIIYRKGPFDTDWGGAIATLDGSVAIFLDEEVEIGEVYEYRVTKFTEAGTLGYGYIYSGIEVEATHFKDAIILVIDTSFQDSFEASLDAYENALSCEGWTTLRIEIASSNTVEEVKDLIVALTEQDQYNITNLLLIGDVAVPYAGNIAPDGHSNHVGAWPCDAYYGDLDGTWTDVSVNNTTAASTRNHNVPGDGKFDQSVIASDIELAIGRIDFSNLDVYTESEGELLNQYFQKNIAFRTKAFVPMMRGLIENNFSGFEEGFGQNGLKNFAPLLGPDNYSYKDFDNVENDSYIWVYGCGGGTYTSAGGISTSANLAADSIESVFTMLFGSYFGDWDSQNNFLRSAIASGTVLSCSWSARPNWQYHPMGMGFNLGHCTLLSHNNPGFSYSPGFGNRQIHVALMGDPTLTMYVVDPVKNLMVSEENGHATVAWEASTDTIEGYYLYRKIGENNTFQLVQNELFTETSFIDSCLTQGQFYEYMVRASKLEITPSGSFHNLSIGVKAGTVILGNAFPVASFDIEVNLEEVILLNSSENADSYFWDFGDNQNSTEMNPSHVFENPGEFDIVLVASNACGSDTLDQVATISGLQEILWTEVQLYPNPADKQIQLELPASFQQIDIQILNNEGKLIKQISRQNQSSLLISVSDFAEGMYWIYGILDEQYISGSFQVIR